MISKFDSLFAGHADLDNLGYGGTPINRRRYPNVHLASALGKAESMAKAMDRLGYNCFWIAEHHFVGVASSSPAVLIGQIAAATNKIRVGSAAVQLGYTTVAAVVESFGMLEAFYPGRIDLGVGRGNGAIPGSSRSSHRPKPARRGSGAKSTVS